MTDLQFIISTDSLSTLLGEREEQSRKRQANDHSVCGGGQRLNKRHSVPLRDFVLVPIPAYIDTEA